VQNFYTAFDGLVNKYTEAKDTTRVALLDEMFKVFLTKVFYAPIGYETHCVDSSKTPRVCTSDYVPVCGEDIYTYANKCALEAAGVTALHEGVCTAEDKPQFCTMEYAPVC
jgi:hypothetical protein